MYLTKYQYRLMRTVRTVRHILTALVSPLLVNVTHVCGTQTGCLQTVIQP